MSRIIHCLGRQAVVFARMPHQGFMATMPNRIGDYSHNQVVCIPSSRNIFTARSLGLTTLEQLQTQKQQMFAGESRERYVERLRGFVEAGDNGSFYKEDLINMIGIAESDADLDLIEEMLEKTSAEQRNFYGGWGSAIMRLLYKHGKVDRAIKCISDTERFGEFFNNRSCYKVVMTMLYDHGKYQEMIDLYKKVEANLPTSTSSLAYTERTGQKPGVDRDLVLLYFAALAKTNSPDALDKAKKIVDEKAEGAKFLGLRPTSFLVYLALQNGDLRYALDVISTVVARSYVSIRDCKILALLRLGRYEDVLLQLREFASNTSASRAMLLKSTFDELQQSKDKIQDVATRQELDDLLTEFKENNHVSEESMDELIFRQIDFDVEERRNEPPRFQNSERRGGFRSGGSDERQQFRRPRYNNEEGDRYRMLDDDEDSFKPRRDDRRGGSARGGGNRRQFAFQNVNFEA